MAIQQASDPDQQMMPTRPSEPEPRLFTVDEYYKMAEAGILTERDRVQLVRGVIYTMNPIGSRHHSAVIWLTKLFGSRLFSVAELSVQGPVRLKNRSEPEPDVAILHLQPDQRRPYSTEHPTSSDVYFLVEIADSSLRFDLGEKALAYAEDGIAELWVADQSGDRLVVHREPTANGYASIRVVARGETIGPLAFPDVSFTADEILG